MNHRCALLVVAASMAACVVTPLDESNQGKMARGGIPPQLNVGGYLFQPGQEVIIEARDRRFADSWHEMARAVSAGPPLGDNLYPWTAKGVQPFFPYYFKDAGNQSSVEFRARTAVGDDMVSLATFTAAGFDCVLQRMRTGTKPDEAGRQCATGGTFEVNWQHDGVNVDNGSLDCTSARKLHALAGEESHRVAVRLTPPSYPFEVNQLRYHMINEDFCARDVPHKVELYVGTGQQPATTPTAVRTFNRALPVGVANERAEFIDLTSPVVLTSGQHLFVSIEMTRLSSDRVACVTACNVSEGAYVSGRNWWSNAASPPYSWQELGTFDIFMKPRVAMSGRAL